MVRRLRRMKMSAGEKDVGNFPDTQRKSEAHDEKGEAVSEIDKSIVQQEDAVIRLENRAVYHLNEGARRASPEAAPADGAGREERPRPAGPEGTPVRRDRGRDSDPVPPERLEDGWLSGEPLPARPAAEWIAGESEAAAPETKWTAGESAPAGPETVRLPGGVGGAVPAPGWIAGGETPVQTPVEEPRPGLTPASDELRWAEQADRAFRRDSRRYDVGFYLY